MTRRGAPWQMGSIPLSHGPISMGNTGASGESGNQSVLSEDTTAVFERQLTIGERASDRFADFAGSWTFIILFFVVLVAWIAINSLILLFRPFDPFPFILLNQVLSCIAAIQAPIIIMSQNRQEARDRSAGPARLPGEPEGRTGNPEPA
jgi:uncharacterized membrane protein